MFPVAWSPRYVRSLWAHWPLGGKERYGQLFVTIRGTLQIRSLLSGQNCFGSRAPRLHSFIAKILIGLGPIWSKKYSSENFLAVSLCEAISVLLFYIKKGRGTPP